MSKSKTKKARREAKRDQKQKAATHHRKLTKNNKFQQSKVAAPYNKYKFAATSGQIQSNHEVPFGAYDRILLVGEGDFSFTHSIVIHHGCASVTATSLDSEGEVLSKYPSASSLLAEMAALTPPVPVHHSIDATKLSSYKYLRETAPFSHIIFNFPHTGGLSTDVNRQVRHNQSLLVSFFKSSLPLLEAGGKIIITLFEGEPYTLWNVRDLARHTGLRVLESFRFDWGTFPGYSHVRTLGTLEGGGAWRGEERGARTYIFEKSEDTKQPPEKSKKATKSKRKARDYSAEDSDDV